MGFLIYSAGSNSDPASYWEFTVLPRMVTLDLSLELDL